MTKKVYVIGPGLSYASSILDRKLTDNIEEADIVVLTGGADVHPSTYNKKVHPSTYGALDRDNYEIEMYSRVRNDQLVVGVCRGAQLLCVLNGGILVQDVSRHAMGAYHEMKGLAGTDYEDQIFPITSLHHQMMYPFDIPQEYYTTIFNAFPARSLYYEGDGINPDILSKKGEPELIVFHAPGKPIGLAIQGHPEMMPKDCSTVLMFNELIDKLLDRIHNNGH
jgi:hypothetical protein